MDAETNIKGRVPNRHVTEVIVAACGSTNAALHLPAIDLFDVGEIFKKTPCVAGMLQDGDIFEIDAEAGTANVKLSVVELAGHKTKWRPRATNHTSGARWTYAQQVGPALDGAVTHPGGAHEKQCYADI